MPLGAVHPNKNTCPQKETPTAETPIAPSLVMGSGPAPAGRPGMTSEKPWQEWEIPREAGATWPDAAKELHARWWAARIARQREIDASIAAKAELEYLYDKPYPDHSRIRVAGPFTVESLSPHRVLAVDQDDSLIDTLALAEDGADWGDDTTGFAEMVLENLKTAGVQQAHKEDRIAFTSLVPWPGKFICAEGCYIEGGHPEKGSSPAAAGEGNRAQHGGGGELASARPNARTPSASLRSPPPPPGGGGAGSSAGSTAGTAAGVERRAAIFLGPDFGTVSRPDLVEAAREAADARFDVVIACAFNFDAHSSEFERLGRIPILKARMNADLHMAGELKSTASGNLFVIFGEPDIEIEPAGDSEIRVRIRGVDVFHPQRGEVVSGGPELIALWFIDTDYNEESFFVRHAYFLGAETDPYKALKTTLKAEIDAEAWASLRSDTSRPFPKPKSGRIAVKVINHLGDEVMKVFPVR